MISRRYMNGVIIGMLIVIALLVADLHGTIVKLPAAICIPEPIHSPTDQ